MNDGSVRKGTEDCRIGLAAVVFSGEDPGVVRARKAAAIRTDVNAAFYTGFAAPMLFRLSKNVSVVLVRDKILMKMSSN